MCIQGKVIGNMEPCIYVKITGMSGGKMVGDVVHIVTNGPSLFFLTIFLSLRKSKGRMPCPEAYAPNNDL